MEITLLGKVDRNQGFAWVKGELVRMVQVSLNTHSAAELQLDSIYGSDTAAAVAAWQEANGKVGTGDLSYRAFAELTKADEPTDFDICLQVTASF